PALRAAERWRNSASARLSKSCSASADRVFPLRKTQHMYLDLRTGYQARCNALLGGAPPQPPLLPTGGTRGPAGEPHGFCSCCEWPADRGPRAAPVEGTPQPVLVAATELV